MMPTCASKAVVRLGAHQTRAKGQHHQAATIGYQHSGPEPWTGSEAVNAVVRGLGRAAKRGKSPEKPRT